MRNNFLNNKIFYGLILIVALRLILVFLTVNNIFPDLGIKSDIWLPSLDWAGDKDSFFQDAERILAGDPRLSRAAGFSLFLIPFIKFFGIGEISGVIKSVNIFYSVIWYSLAIVLVYFLAKKILASRWQALAVDFLFVVYPYIFYYCFYFLSRPASFLERFFSDRFTHLIFLGPISDPLSAVLALGSLGIFLWLASRKTVVGWGYFLLGLTVSWAVITRWQNAVLVIFYFLIILGWRKFRPLTNFILGGLPLMILQFYFNFASRGLIFATVYGLSKGQEGNVPMVSLSYPLRIFSYPWEYLPALIPVLLLGAAVFILGLRYLILTNRQTALIAAGYCFCYIVPLLFLEPVMRGPRYFLPVIPIIFIFSWAGLVYGVYFLKVNLFSRTI